MAAADYQPIKDDEVHDKDAPKLLDEDEDYNSEDDPDFDDNKPAEESGEESESEEEHEGEDIAGAERPRKWQKMTGDDGYEAAQAAEFDDRATTQTATERTQKVTRRKGAKTLKERQKDDDLSDFSEDDVGGEGGLIKTRAQKLREKEERKRSVGQGEVTIDVDALWERLNHPSNYQLPPKSENTNQAAITRPSSEEAKTKSPLQSANKDVEPSKPITLPDEEKITIRRVYKFAGEVVTEERVVSRDSAEAKLYLASANADGTQTGKDGEAGADKAIEIRTNEDGEPLIRATRRFSRFDPNPPKAFRRSWARGAVASEESAVSEAPLDTTPPATTDDNTASTTKLTTLTVSQMDWAAYVDKKGVQEELEAHSRAKEGFHDRMEFLRRVDMKKEEQRRDARMKAS